MRRLSDSREAEVLDLALDLLARNGYGNLTMDAVAAAAHTSKATIYRQWGGKAGLVSAALGHLRKVKPDGPPRRHGFRSGATSCGWPRRSARRANSSSP